MEYRPLPDDRERQFQDFVQYAFRPESGPQDDYDWEVTDRPGDARGLFDGEDLLAVCRHYWFRTRVRGCWTEMPGLSAVASPPEHRRQGHVARLLAESLAEYRDRGDFLTALWAFEHPFYERQGWGLATKYVEYDCPPEALAFARDAAREAAGGERAPGELCRADPDDHADLAPVRSAHAEGFELEIDRTERWWRRQVFDSWRKDPYVYAWERDGETRGYVVYRIEDGEDGKRLVTEDFAYADREARLNLLRLLADHDSQVETVTLRGPEDTRLLDEVRDPAAVTCEIKPGPMARLVDVPAAVTALDYPGSPGAADATDIEFVLSVSDPLAEWNDRRFRIAVADGTATCDPTDDDPDAEVGVSTLSQLFVGYHSVADAEALGDLEIRDPTARETLAAMFPEKEVLLRENF